MTPETREAADMRRQNDYLTLRNAQLQREVTCLEAEALRLRQELERQRALRPVSPATTGRE
jgi:hypothetical protein